MNDCAALKKRFEIPGRFQLSQTEGGLVKIDVNHPLATATAYLHGGHVGAFQARDQLPLLFMGPRSLFQPDKAIRGGVPVVFPWFGPCPPPGKGPQHGFARTMPWSLVSVQDGAEGLTFVMELGPTDSTRAAWPNEFRVRHEVTVGRRLQMVLAVTNTGSTSFRAEAALHTYFSVSDVRRACIEGLGGCEFIDKVDGFKRKREDKPSLVLDGETDRVYLGTPGTVTIVDAGFSRRLVVEAEGSASTVVWNPWETKGNAMADLGTGSWRSFVCVETTNAADDARTVEPDQTHTLRAVARAE